MKIVTSRAFNQDVSLVKRLARAEPVFVTDRGKPTHVLLSIDAFRQMAGQTATLIDLLAMDETTVAAPAPDWRGDGGWGR